MITFGSLILSFFSSYLANQRGNSPETIASYSDCIRLLINYCCNHLSITVDKLALDMISDTLILDFLDYLEKKRNNSPKTRNQRLAAIKTFFRFAARQEPTLGAVCERVCNISAKKSEHKTIQPLENYEVKEILSQPDSNTLSGARDQAILALLYNTGARVQEMIDLKISDLNMENPMQVILTGKGKKQRIVPLYSQTVEAIQHYLNLRQNAGIEHERLCLNSKNQPISRFGVAYLIRKYVSKATRKCSSLLKRTVTPHTFRHTTALHLIQSGVDITVVKEWLGHACIKTTTLYVEIDIDMKRKALQACPPPIPGLQLEKPQWKEAPILAFLHQLSKKVTLC